MGPKLADLLGVMKYPAEFWNKLAPHHSTIENNFFNLPSVRAIMREIQSPVLVVGAGQGLIVEELVKRGFQCDGIDLSPEMIRYAKLRRGLTLLKADARSMPFRNQTYATVIYASGVLDFIGDEETITAILSEGRRVLKESGKIFVAFYRLSDALEHFVGRVGLLRNHLLAQKASLQTYLLRPAQMLRWVQNQANTNTFKTIALLLRLAVQITFQERVNTFKMQKIFRNAEAAQSLIETAPEYQPYRNETEIRRMFARLAVPVKQFRILKSCFVVQL